MQRLASALALRRLSQPLWQAAASGQARQAASSSDQIAVIKSLRQLTGAPMSDVRAALIASSWDQEEAMKELRKKGLAASGKKAGRLTMHGQIGLALRPQSAAIVEVNSETDFAAATDKFISLVGQVAKAALAHTPDGSIGGDTLNSLEAARQAVDDVAAVVRENIQIRRGFRISTEEGVVGAYVHNSAKGAAGAVGKQAAVVALEGAPATASKEAQQLADTLAMHVVAMRPLFLNRGTVPAADLKAESDFLKEQVLGSGKPPQVIEKIVTGRLEKYYQEVCFVDNPFVLVGNQQQRVSQVLEDFGKAHACNIAITQFARLTVGEGIEKPATET
mmetsp:Transcript_18678/g.56453  ORF Transcript_18678/g.56453 Transcript_18678/m.56453 type:complete len:334 (-) Transcript_18678:269-1270(-)|eukprot:CAMPEP_0206147360 /NCGR_PEP_ID=MMETSP1473-20131121/33170_1 /ASSEMBLY_ACC=CAM_ASM_001109 /TAXON_ID=1461547 /ORGANISM="Stichococcus sp, Strain RCC1054" /LENGTH=333 /DNA_ID=CAMNT_0053544255 /DNA_START=122 /DNA_END=1123 /DNA_ORIENTATION=+